MSQRWGLTLPLPGISLAEHEEHVRQAEAAGFDHGWLLPLLGAEGFAALRETASIPIYAIGGLRVEDVEIRKADLEDVFLDVMKEREAVA